MWFLRNVVWLVIMVLLVGFAILNVHETVTAIIFPGSAYRLVPANVALFERGWYGRDADREMVESFAAGLSELRGA